MVTVYLVGEQVSNKTVIITCNKLCYGCETWSLTLMEERRLRVFKNRVLRRIFGSRWDKVTGQWRKLHNEELNDMYSSSNIVQVIKLRRMRSAGYVARMRKRRGVYTFWFGNLR